MGVTYLRRVDLLEVLDNTDNTIGDLRLIEEGALHAVGEEPAGQGVEGERQKPASGGSDGSSVDPQMLEESAAESHGGRREESETPCGSRRRGRYGGAAAAPLRSSPKWCRRSLTLLLLLLSFQRFRFVGLYFRPMARMVSA